MAIPGNPYWIPTNGNTWSGTYATNATTSSGFESQSAEIDKLRRAYELLVADQKKQNMLAEAKVREYQQQMALANTAKQQKITRVPTAVEWMTGEVDAVCRLAFTPPAVVAEQHAAGSLQDYISTNIAYGNSLTPEMMVGGPIAAAPGYPAF